MGEQIKMTYHFSGSKNQDGNAEVKAIFRYEENILYGGDITRQVSDKEFNDNRKKVWDQRLKRQKKVMDTIVGFLQNRYQVTGLKNMKAFVSDDNFIVTNFRSNVERRYTTRSDKTNYDVEVSGKLRPGEHLDDMLDCDALDAQLKPIFEGESQ